MNTRIDISVDLALPCQECNSDTPRFEKFGWKPGMIFSPEWHEWFSQLQVSREKGTSRPAPPDVPHYMECPSCNGKGEKTATVEEFVSYHLNAYQLELFKSKNITFSKGN